MILDVALGLATMAFLALSVSFVAWMRERRGGSK